jgi:hypothetical protein
MVKMTLTIEDKIKLIQEKILEAERVIRYTRNPSEEDIDAQILVGIREQIIDQVKYQEKVIEILNGMIVDLNNGIDQIG